METKKKQHKPSIIVISIIVVIGTLIGSFVIIAIPVWAQPAYVNSWSIGTGVVSSQIVTVSTSNNDAIIVLVAIKDGINCHVNSVTDNGGSSYSELVEYDLTPSITVIIEMWVTGITNSISATSVTITLTNKELRTCSGSKLAISIGEYSGATGYGHVCQTASSFGADPGPCTLTIQDTNGALVGGFATNAGTAQTSNIGTLRQAPVATGGSSSTKVGGSLVDQINQATGSVSIRTTHEAVAWIGVGVELRNSSTFLVSASCTTSETPLTANQSKYYQGIINYIRFTCTADNKAYTTSGSISATPTFTLPTPFTQLWSFESTTSTGTTCSGGTGAWQMTSGTSHSFPSGTKTWDYCAVIPNTATADSTSFSVAWNST